MKIAIVGYGQMGRMIGSVANSKGIDVVSIIDPKAEDAKFKQLSKESLKDVDVVIDFTVPDVVLDNIRRYAELKVNAVIGTTGWYDHIDDVKVSVEQSGIGLIYASNFSIGVNAFFKIVEQASKVIDKIDNYDIYAYEMHHNKKKDSPSGTAKSIGSILLENINRKNKIVEEKLDRQIQPDELHFASVRGGSIPGTHAVGFDAEEDTIELKHTARSRLGFAKGAVMAAEFINNKQGFFTIQDMMKDIIG